MPHYLHKVTKVLKLDEVPSPLGKYLCDTVTASFFRFQMGRQTYISVKVLYCYDIFLILTLLLLLTFQLNKESMVLKFYLLCCVPLVEILQHLQNMPIYFPYMCGREEGRFLNCILSVSQWHCCDSQRMFVLQGLRSMKEKVCFFLLLAALPSLCTCHHVLGKHFDVVLAFWRLIPLRASLDVEARIEQSAHAVLSLNERINPSEITLIKTGKITGLCLTYFQGIG